MTNEERQLLADIRKEASSGLSCITFGNNCISRLWRIVHLCDSVLDKPPANNKQTTRKKAKRKTIGSVAPTKGAKRGGPK